VYEFMDAAPRAWLANKSSVVALPLASRSPNLRWLHWSSQSMTFEANTSPPQTLILLEKPDSGWRASVNGIFRPVQTLGPTMIAVDLDVAVGRLLVELGYSPRLPLMMSLFAWGPLAGVGLVVLIRRRRGAKKTVESKG
jgi:hypothetical protein